MLSSNLTLAKYPKIILWCCFILSLWINLGKSALFVEEPRRALITLEMQFNENPLVPTQMGEFYYKKPPLFNWIMIVFNQVMGESEWTSRSITVFSFLILCWMIFRFTKPYLGREIAEFSALFYGISCNIYFTFSMLGEIDLFYAMLTFPMLLLPYSLMKKQKYIAMFLVLYLFGLLGFLTKGFTSPIFMGITLFIVLVFFKKIRLLYNPWHILVVILFCGLLVLYFYAYSKFNSVESYINGMWSQSNERAPWNINSIGRLLTRWTITPLNAFKDILPGGIMLVFLFQKKIRSELWKNEFLQYVVLIFGINFLVYWIAPGTRSRYLMGLYPFPIIIAIWILFKFFRTHNIFQIVLKWISWVCIGMILLATICLPFIKEIPPIDHMLLYIVIMLTLIGVVVVYFLFHPKQHLARLVTCFILVRFGFDFFVFPIRSITSEATKIKEQAKVINEIVQYNNLWFQREEFDGTVSLELVYYLEFYRQKILQKNLNKNCVDYYIVHQEEVILAEVEIFYEWEWMLNKYFLVKFKNCSSNE